MVKGLSRVLLACTYGPEHPISPPASPMAPPLTFPIVKGNCGKVQQHPPPLGTAWATWLWWRMIKQHPWSWMTSSVLTTVKPILTSQPVGFHPEKGTGQFNIPLSCWKEQGIVGLSASWRLFLRFWVAWSIADVAETPWWGLWQDRTSVRCLTLVSSSAVGPEGAWVSWLSASAWLPSGSCVMLGGAGGWGGEQIFLEGTVGMIRQGLAACSCCCYCYRAVLHGGDAEA